MDKYILDLKNDIDYTAGSKARNDAESILKGLGFEPRYIHLTKKKKNIYGTIAALSDIKQQLTKIMNSLSDHSVLLVQYPWDFLRYGFSNIICEKAKKKNIKTIVLIHDLNSCRTGSKVTRYYYNFIVREFAFLNNFDHIIAHNNSMKSILLKNGVNEGKIKIINLFDYLTSVNINIKSSQKNYRNVNIGGNLSLNKAGYVYKLAKLHISNYNYSLFGPYFDGKSTEHVTYNGVFPAEELPKHINSGFGLVWDGDSLDSCNGNFGEYLKINNPHKASMYIACGIPVIVWRKAAIAKFVLDNNVGIAINSLNELDDFFGKLTLNDYRKYLDSVSSIREKITAGACLKECIDNCIE